MKILLVNGSPHEYGCTRAALDEIAKELKAQNIDSEIFWLGLEPLAGCIGCGACRRDGANGCFRNDKVNEFISLSDTADGFVFGTPVHWASASGAITSFMDRVFFAAGGKLRGKPQSLLKKTELFLRRLEHVANALPRDSLALGNFCQR